MLLDGFDVSGGHGGAGGRGGSGGSGGWGGMGGSGYSWTETEYYSDNGELKSRSNSRYNPGGMPGMSGSSGQSGQEGYAGRAGNGGDFRILVHYANGDVRTYRELYDIQIENYRLEDEDHDGIFEPGEHVWIRDLKIRNSGGMPTPPPPNSYVQIQLDGDSRVIPEPVYLQLPHSLQPGESYTFSDESLPFRIRDASYELPVKGEPFRDVQQTRPRAVLTTVDREFAHSHNPEAFSVEFPVEIRPIRALPAMARGEKATVYFEVKNTSTHDLGSASEIGRALSLLLYGRSEASKIDVGFVDSEGSAKALNLESAPLFKAIAKLRAGESRIVKGVVVAPKEAEAQATYSLGATLSLGTRDKASETRAIHSREQKIVIVESYEFDPRADVLLITNGATTTEELKAWKAMLRQLGLKPSVWNLSYYGFLDLAKELADQKHDLIREFAGKTIVLINNRYESDGNRLVDARVHLAKDAVLEAANQSNVNFLVVGDSNDGHGNDLIRSLVVPTENVKEMSHDTVADFETELERQDGPDTYGRGPRPGTRAPVSAMVHRISYTDKYWRDAHEGDLKAVADRVEKDLEAKYKNRRYVVTYEYRPLVLRKGGLFSRSKIYLGDVLVRQIPDQPENVAMSLTANDSQLHDPKFIWSYENELAVLSSLSFENKLELFDSLLRRANAAGVDDNLQAEGNMLVDAMLADISYEQRAALEGFFRHQVKLRMRDLETLASHSFSTRITPGTPAEAIAARLIAGVHVLADHSYIWFWSKLTVFPITTGRSTMEWNYHYINQLEARIFATKSARAHAKPLVQRRYAELKDRAYSNARDSKNWRNEEVRRLLEWPLRRDGVSAATNAWASYTERVLEPDTYQQMKHADEEDRIQRAQLEQENKASKIALQGSSRS